MDDRLEWVEDAAQLLSYGLRPKLRPAKEPLYDQLLRRYRAEGVLREHVEAIARGLGLCVLGATTHGLALGALDESPFAMRLRDYRRSGLSVSERVCHGLIQLSIAAWCFPTAESLDEPDTVAGAVMTVPRLAEYLVQLCAELAERTQEDPELGGPELQEAWRLVLARAETRTTPDGRRAPSTLAGMVEYGLEQLERGGLVRRMGEREGERWQALGAYRLQVRELAGHRAAELVRHAAAGARAEEEV